MGFQGPGRLGRQFLLVDDNPEAVRVMARRLAPYAPELVGCDAILKDLDLEPSLFVP